MKSATAKGKMYLVAALAMMMTTPAYAAVQIDNKTDISITVFIPCAAGGAGEVVDLSGPLHTLVSMTINGNNVSGYFHFQPQGIVGVGGPLGTSIRQPG
jgi:hypothetical protein